jgi:hypothetical protein
MPRKVLLAAAAIAGLLVASPARANVLNPGDTGTAPDAFSSAILGTTVVGPTVVTGSGNVGGEYMNVSVTESVVRDTVNGGLDFVYQVTNNSNVATPPGYDQAIIERITVSRFGGQYTDVGYITGTGQVPSTVDRSTNGRIIGFNYSGANAVQPGGTTAELVVRTKAVHYDDLGTANTINGQTVTLTGYEPSAVPEPSTMALAGLGALGLIGYGIRRRQTRTA